MKNLLSSKLGYYLKALFLGFLGIRVGSYLGILVSSRLVFQSDRALIIGLLMTLAIIATAILVTVARLRRMIISVVDGESHTNYGFSIISSTSLYFLIVFTLVGFSAPFVSGLLSVFLFQAIY